MKLATTVTSATTSWSDKGAVQTSAPGRAFRACVAIQILKARRGRAACWLQACASLALAGLAGFYFTQAMPAWQKCFCIGTAGAFALLAAAVLFVREAVGAQ